ncbi:MAG: helix-turn-helix domain-containing protein [Thermoprotei archaeon]
MILPDEIIAKAVIPALRAMIAKELIEKYGLTQQSAAKLLNVSQAAISNYMRGIRGIVVNLEQDKDIRTITSNIADMLVNNSDPKDIVSMFNLAIRIITMRGILCNVHKKFEPIFENCDICNIKPFLS